MSQFQIFTEKEKKSLRKAGSVLHDCLHHTASFVRPGISTSELDAIAEEFILSHDGARPAFKGYHGFPGTLCTSVNDQCVHAIPGDRILQEGDIIALDCGVICDELYTDACITVGAGQVSADTQKLLDTTEQALKEALKVIKKGAHVGDISHAVQSYVESQGFACVRSLTGHGLGKTLHQFPDIPNVGTAGTGPVLPAGTLIAIEPIVSAGNPQVVDAGDGWTISTKDGSLSAHFEHSLLTTDDGYEIIA